MYILDDTQFRILKAVERGLYGNGSVLTPDARRDLANTLNTILFSVEHDGKIEDDYELVKKESK